MTISPVVQAHNTNILPVVSAPEGAQDLWLLPTLEDRVLSAFVPHRSRVCRSRTAAALDASVTSSSSSSSSSSSALQTRMHSTIINKYFIDKWSKNSDEMPHRQRVTPHGCKWIRPMVDLSNTWFLVKATHVGQLPKRHLIRFSCFSRAHPSLKPTKQYALQWFWMGRTTPKNCHFPWGILNTIWWTWFLLWVHTSHPPPSNGISISSAVFVGLSDSLTIRLTDRPTDKTRYYICHNRPMWPHNNSNKVSP